MNTARPRTPALRTRILAGPRCVLLVALLTFAFLYSHGVSLDGVRGHTDAVTGVLAHEAESTVVESTSSEPHDEGRGEGHGGTHSAEECATSEPQPAPTLSPPSAYASAPCLHSRRPAAAGTCPRPAPVPNRSRPPGTTAVLRI